MCGGRQILMTHSKVHCESSAKSPELESVGVGKAILSALGLADPETI